MVDHTAIDAIETIVEKRLLVLRFSVALNLIFLSFLHGAKRQGQGDLVKNTPTLTLDIFRVTVLLLDVPYGGYGLTQFSRI